MRTVLAGAVLSLIAIAAFSFTPMGANVASVIGAGDSTGSACFSQVTALHPNAARGESTITKTDLNDDGTDDRIIKLTDAASCGTNGCIHELCVRTGSATELVTFGYAANDLVVLGTKTNGMYDLTLNSTVNLTWDGERYAFGE